MGFCGLGIRTDFIVVLEESCEQWEFHAVVVAFVGPRASETRALISQTFKTRLSVASMA